MFWADFLCYCYFFFTDRPIALMKLNDYKKYEGRWICNRCKEFIPQIKIRRASRKADKKRNSFCQKCRIEGTQFSAKRNYSIPVFLVWCVWYYFWHNAVKEGWTHETGWKTFSGWLHYPIAPVLTSYAIAEILTAYFQRRNRRTIRKALKKKTDS